MISWQHLESDKLLCQHEAILHKTYLFQNESSFYKHLFKGRQDDARTNYERNLSLNLNSKNTGKKKEEKSKKGEQLFRDQTYLNSRDFLCEIEKHVKS